jgi:hypothetical protein
VTTQTAVRSCPACGKSIKADATFCIYCFANSGSAAHAPAVTVNDGSDAQQATLPIRQRKSHADAVGRRYRDGYVVADAVIAHGTRLKTLAIVVAVVTVLIVLVVAGNFRGGVALGIAAAGIAVTVAVCGVIHAQGVRTCAEGQHLLASLDVAVNTSPFLTDPEKAQAMSL